QPVAEMIAEEAELVARVGDVLRRLVPGGPCSDRFAESCVVPPGRVEARIGLQDALALRYGRRHRPGRRDGVRLAKILEQQVPRLGLGVPGGVETSWRKAHGRRRG